MGRIKGAREDRAGLHAVPAQVGAWRAWLWEGVASGRWQKVGLEGAVIQVLAVMGAPGVSWDHGLDLSMQMCVGTGNRDWRACGRSGICVSGGNTTQGTRDSIGEVGERHPCIAVWARIVLQGVLGWKRGASGRRRRNGQGARGDPDTGTGTCTGTGTGTGTAIGAYSKKNKDQVLSLGMDVALVLWSTEYFEWGLILLACAGLIGACMCLRMR